ncbi:hypothetical protein Ancab_010824 [Ancistrocladus abbreviatus]
MDLETENRIVAILLKEAAELQRQAEKEGVLAYLRQPNVRGRPNSRFLTATVLGMQQANRAVEVNEMWRVRQKELQLDNRLKQRSISGSSHSSRGEEGESSRNTIRRQEWNDDNSKFASSSSKKMNQDCYSGEDEGLRDEEIEEFLHSRVKRGRGDIGSRMNETGPYLPHFTDNQSGLFISASHVREERLHQHVCGPEKPSFWKSYHSSDDEENERRRKKSKKSRSRSPKEHSRKHQSKQKSRDKKRKRKEKKRH